MGMQKELCKTSLIDGRDGFFRMVKFRETVDPESTANQKMRVVRFNVVMHMEFYLVHLNVVDKESHVLDYFF